MRNTRYVSRRRKKYRGGSMNLTNQQQMTIKNRMEGSDIVQEPIKQSIQKQQPTYSYQQSVPYNYQPVVKDRASEITRQAKMTAKQAQETVKKATEKARGWLSSLFGGRSKKHRKRRNKKTIKNRKKKY